MAPALNRIAEMLAEPPPSVPILSDTPSQDELLRHYALLAKAYATDAHLTRQTLLVVVHEMQDLQHEVRRGRRTRKAG
jgi:acyl-CoA-binding protein